MKKNKLENRIENAVNAFFEDENKFENSQLTVIENSSVLANNLSVENEKLTTEKIDTVIDLLKKVFAFFPGTQVLYLFGAFAVYTKIVVPYEFQSVFNLWILFWVFAGIFMTWAGLGDLKNKKHWLLPASSLVTGTVVGLFVSVLEMLFPNLYKVFWGDLPIFYLFLPLAFIIPVLVKNWIDKEEIK
jgi:hypothetical protein